MCGEGGGGEGVGGIEGSESSNAESQQDGSSGHLTEAMWLCTYGKYDRSAVLGCMAEVVTMTFLYPSA